MIGAKSLIPREPKQESDRDGIERRYGAGRICKQPRHHLDTIPLTKRSMKNIRGIVWVFLTSMLAANTVTAGNFDLEIHCVPKRVDQNVKKASDGDANTTKEHWVYDVTIENRTFKDLTNLEVKYIIFFKQEQLGVKADATPRRQNGNFSIPALKPHEKKSFSTDAVELNKSNLVGNWIYSSGAKPNAQDTLVGLALRVYQNGAQFAEFANPSTLTRERWE